MGIDEVYDIWLKNVEVPELQRELLKIKNKSEEKTERFYKFLEFGTAGLRGIMGVGTNRLNVYTIGKTTQGFANYLLKKSKNPSVAISYDSRIRSKLFAYHASEVMAANGIKVYLVCELSPTPFLSFAVRKLGCSAGIMITASHNTSEYNGYKCYGQDGAQITKEIADEIYAEILKVDVFSGVKQLRIQDALEEKIVSFMDKNVTEEYLTNVVNQKLSSTDFSNLNVVYTSLNGSGNKFICEALKKVGLRNLNLVEEQSYPDGNFTTCKYPNPENIEAFNLGIAKAKSLKADLIIASDPDADRLGACAKHKGEYKLISGNQLGVLLFYYIIKKKKEFTNFPKRLIVIKSIVSTKMINAIAKKENCEVIEVETGFKNIAKEIANLEKEGKLSSYALGFEESNGYLCGSYVRDKDAVSAAVLVCEMASYFKRNNLSLVDALDKISEKYGYYGEENLSFEFKGQNGKSKIENIISYFENSHSNFLGTVSAIKVSSSVRLDLGNENEIIVRPSGTEPKLKVYILAHDKSQKLLSERLRILSENIKKIVSKIGDV